MSDPTLPRQIQLCLDQLEKLGPSDHSRRQQLERWLRELRLRDADARDAEADPGDLP